jgi:hypothetical protein
MGDLGDLSSFLKEGNVSNLEWLDVDEAEYRSLDKLPKQNLDIAPDLQALWAHQDEPSTTYLVPNTGPVKPFPGAGEVHTMGDLSEAHGRLNGGKGDDVTRSIERDTRYAMMVSQDHMGVRRALMAKYPMAVLQANRAVIASVFAERGLVGGVYIEAKDFPNCHNSPRVSTAFVRKHACDAKYIKSKPECGGCIHAKKTGNSTNCAVFHKEVVLDVPYTDQLAADVEKLNAVRGRAVVQGSGLPPKERVKLAVLAQVPSNPQRNVYQGVGENQLPKIVTMPNESVQEQLVSASALMSKRDAKAALSLKSRPIVAFIRRELLKGRTATDLVATLKVSFPMQDLAQTRAEWEPHFKEAGLYGAIYSTQDSFNECREGADFLAKHNPTIRAMVAGAKCGSCIYNKVSRCMLYGKPLVKQADDIYTWPTVEAVLQEHRTAGRIEQWEKSASGLGAPDPRTALKMLHARVTGQGPKPEGVYSNRMDLFHAWAGNRNEYQANATTTRDIVKTAAKYQNEGLYGRDFIRALRAKYEVRDLAAARESLKPLVAEQGLQGIQYVDASVYDDYGHGCEEPARLFRAKNVKYAKLGSKCGSCVHNHNNHCAKLNKPLVVEPPYLDKRAEQQAMLNSGPSTHVDEASLMAPSGLSMIQEYELQNHGMTIDLNPVSAAAVQPVEIRLGRQKIRV